MTGFSTLSKAVLCSLTLLTSWAWAQADVEVFAEMGEPFTLYINQVQQNSTPAARVLVPGLDGEFFQFRVDFSDPSLPDLTKNAVGVEAGTRTAYMVRLGRNGDYVLRLHNVTPLSGVAAAPPMDSEWESEGWGEVTIEQPTLQVETRTVPTQPGAQAASSTNAPGGTSTTEEVSMQISMSLPGMPMGVSTSVTTTTSVSSSASYSASSTVSAPVHTPAAAPTQPAPRPAARPVPMAPADFQSYVKAIQSKGFEDAKLATAKAPLSSAYFTADQIRQVMTLFGFEETRVQFATLARPRCTDPANYYQVYEAFQFESSIEELQEALGE